MKKYLNNLDEGIWLAEARIHDKNKKKSLVILSPIKNKKKSKKFDRTKSFIDEIKFSIDKNGSRTIKISKIFEVFGYSKRSEKNIKEIMYFLRQENLFVFPEFTLTGDFHENVRLSKFPIICKGKIFPSEKELEDFVYNKGAYKKLKINEVEKQFSPNGTKDRLDFKGIDENNYETVIELKNEGGGKSAVEQVLRYAGQLKQQFPNKEIRKILITGILNYETATAIHGMNKEEKSSFEWYLYKYDGNSIEFERVKPQEFEEFFKKTKHN